MDTQSIATALLLIPATLFGIIAVRATRQQRTRLGLKLGRGAASEFVHGMAFAAVMVTLIFLIFWGAGLLKIERLLWHPAVLLGILTYFLLLFTLEEVIFRSLLMTGLGMVTGRLAALLLTSVLVAIPYAFSAGSGVLPVIGAVATNMVNGLARWPTGRIWFGIGMRWIWNSAQVALGYAVSGYMLGAPLVDSQVQGSALLTGGQYGPEGGVIGLGVRFLMILYLVFVVRGRFGPWTVERRRTSLLASTISPLRRR